MTDATPLTDAEIENLANQPRAYALTNAKVLATITSLQSDLQRTRDALEIAQYAMEQSLRDPESEIDQEGLARAIEKSRAALAPPTET
jgi:hypothetical protein